MSPNRRTASPLTTWHSQSGLLWISWTWGLSYLVPARDRIAFSEVYPHLAGPMWMWGVGLIIAATIALISERVIRTTRKRPWSWAWGGHMVLAGIYSTLAAAALLQALGEVHGTPLGWGFWGNVISAISRTVLWGYIGYLHSTYARLPRIPWKEESGK